MQVTETKNEGLSRAYAITVPASDIQQRVESRLQELVGQVNIPGFRPGKVPVKLIRQRYGDAVKGEVLQAAVAENASKALADREIQPAMQPKIEVTTFEEGKDLEFKIELDVLPVIEPVDFKTVELERLKARIEDKEVDESLQRMAENFGKTEPVAKPRKSKEGDVVVIDFEGSVGGEAFEGGAAKDYHLELGAGRFIPGFESQLAGAAAGDHVKVEVAFPENYGNPGLAGKDAVFEVDVKEIREKVPATIDDEFAKQVGLETVADLKKQMRQRLEGEYAAVARDRVKRQLLDKLDAVHDFEAPQGMLDAEFDSIWNQYESARKNQELDPEDEKKSEEEVREEFRGIAARRVRLGLLLAAVGQRNNIEVTPEEVNRALIRQAQNFPGHERRIIEAYRNSENLMASLRAPIFEEKVVDFIIEMADVKEREVSAEELLRDPDAGPDAGEEGAAAATAKAGKAKKPAAKKAAAPNKDKPKAKPKAKAKSAKAKE
ncbi:MAG: trigger factor [Alphaproteobacteria bacterium]